MTFSQRSIKYADLIVPLTKCPLGEAVQDDSGISYALKIIFLQESKIFVLGKVSLSLHYIPTI